MVNPVRGEASITIGGVELTLVATMNGLAQISAATGRPTFEDLFQRLVGSEVDTTLAALRIFTVRGVRKADPAAPPETPEAQDRPLSYRDALEAVSPLLDVSALLRLRGPMSSLLDALISAGDGGKIQDKLLGNGSSAQS